MDRFLIQAWSHSSEEVKEACLQHLSSFKNSALHLAAIYGHLPVIRLLLQLKMTAIQANEAGKLPIMLSLQSHKQNNRKQCYQELLAASEPQVYEQQDTSGENIVFI